MMKTPSVRETKTARTDWLTNPVLLIFFLTVLFLMRDAHSSPPCQAVVGQVKSVQGTVEVSRAAASHWQPVTEDARICAGDRMRVRNQSRAKVRLSNDSLLRLDQRTTVTFPASETHTVRSFMELISGALHIFTRTPQPFEVRTRFMNGGVEGTEFFVRVDESSSRLIVYEGRVSATNALGNLVLDSHEAAVAYPNQPPQKQFIVNLTDAVQWALYYPTIIEYWQKDNIDTQTGQTSIAAAARLLTLGSVTEAREIIARILAQEPQNSDALALQAIIVLTQNDSALAQEYAQHAVESGPRSVAARLALSYVQQAYFDIDAALESAQLAATYDPQNALIWARLAELHMSTGELEPALQAARKAVGLNPTLAKTQTVLGFAHLLQMDTRAAESTLRTAIQLDQSDPTPRLGLGLTLIREGELEAGRSQLEIAASLDPGNSLLRSYLGKAYFEERRYPLAETQLEMAVERDPNDPTPWFYSAIQKQTQNRPIEALHDIQKSIELNDNRAVYRSRLLLDQDEAGRGSSLARIFDNLGFEKRAIMQTAQSLSIDPSNHSAHRFLSDIYVNIPRHEIARVSELLQAQLLQPINLNPVQPHMAVADLNIITNTGPAAVGFNEFTPLMESSRPQFVASGIVGSNSTFGNEIVFSQIKGRTSVSLGQFHYQSNGFRKNNDQNHDVLNAFIQHAFTPRLNVQAEVRTRDTNHGDLLLDFDPKAFSLTRRRNLKEDVARVGARYALTPNQDFILSGKYINRNETVQDISRIDLKNSGFQIEGQHQLRHDLINTVSGASFYRFTWDRKLNNEKSVLPFNDMDRENIYHYSNINFFQNLNLTLGLSYDTFSSAISGKRTDKISPKFGIQWNILKNLRLRGAWFETTKSHLIAQQTLEPTQIAGFNQFFDDINGTRSQRFGGGLDYRFSKNLYSGLEISKRILHVPVKDISLITFTEFEHLQRQNEQQYRTYFYWLPHNHWSIKSEFQFEDFKRNSNDPSLEIDAPVHVQTLTAPISLEYFHPSGILSSITGTIVNQKLSRLVNRTSEEAGARLTTSSRADTFFLLDAVIGYRFPNRRGMLNFEARNLLNQKFYYRNINFYQSEAITPRFIPERTFFARVTINF